MRQSEIKTLLFLSICYFLFPPITPENNKKPDLNLRRECVEDCGGQKHYKEVYSKGDALCYDNLFDVPTYISTSCIGECMGVAPAEDQLNCMTEQCKRGIFHQWFCTQPNGTWIGEKECESLVRSGSAKLYGCSRPAEKTATVETDSDSDSA